MPATFSRVRFFSIDVDFILRDKLVLSQWLNAVAKSHHRKIGKLSCFFVSDNFLLVINQQFLQHNTFTDIITFDYSAEEQEKNIVSGEIYISIERVSENAKRFAVSEKNELCRVLAHGLLHLCGFSDKAKQQQKQMRKAEENALALQHVKKIIR